MKVYKFKIPHFDSTETMYVLAENKKQAIEIVMEETNDDYHIVENELVKVYKKPKVILKTDH